ncbi:MAG: TIGR01777 family oxidoreductase [Thermoplasmatota archaeon]
MQVAIIGGTGLVGKRTAALLRDAGHEVIVVSRSKGDVQWDTRSPCPVQAEAIVNLAGASIGGKRWNKAYKQEMVRSRVETTRLVAEANPKAKWVQASAIGYYGINPDGDCVENRGPGDDYLANLCVAWEAEAPASATVLRFGHVLDKREGFLARLLPIYKMRLGGPIASGKQGLPWVHVEDVARAIVWALEHGARGPYNLASPGAGTQRQFNAGLARTLGVCAKAPMPGFALRMVVGELGNYLVGGQQTPPTRLLQEGFTFKHPDLEAALADVLAPDEETK